MKTKTGKLETYYIDGNLGTVHKVVYARRFVKIVQELILNLKR